MSTSISTIQFFTAFPLTPNPVRFQCSLSKEELRTAVFRQFSQIPNRGSVYPALFLLCACKCLWLRSFAQRTHQEKKKSRYTIPSHLKHFKRKNLKEANKNSSGHNIYSLSNVILTVSSKWCLKPKSVKQRWHVQTPYSHSHVTMTIERIPQWTHVFRLLILISGDSILRKAFHVITDSWLSPIHNCINEYILWRAQLPIKKQLLPS